MLFPVVNILKFVDTEVWFSVVVLKLTFVEWGVTSFGNYHIQGGPKK